MVQEFHSREFALFGPLPSSSLSLPTPPAAASFTQRSGLRRLDQGQTPSPNGESIYRPAEPILLPRAFTFGDRETESACWWMVIDWRSYGVRAGVSPSASWSHEVVNHRKQWREVGEQSQGRDPRQEKEGGAPVLYFLVQTPMARWCWFSSSECLWDCLLFILLSSLYRFLSLTIQLIPDKDNPKHQMSSWGYKIVPTPSALHQVAQISVVPGAT